MPAVPKTDAQRSGGKLGRFRYEYGAEPLHLIATIASLAICGYAILRIFENPFTGAVLLWLGAAVIAHDFIALPFYSLLNRIAEETADLSVAPRRRVLMGLNHIRVPAAGSLLLLAMYFPLILQIDERRYGVTTGLDLDRYLGNWLGITGVLFVVSGLVFAFRIRGGRGKRPVRPERRPPFTPGVPRPLLWAGRATIAVGALVVLWAVAALIVGTLTELPG